MLIREIILESFMSYDYARIPLKPGVNIVCGPNGSGKSSILLGISVALGQSYTERSKRLSDLIRWGREMGRVTLVLDNSRRGGRRPVPKIKKDEILLTRVLRRDGRYWFELDNRPVNRSDVLRLLSRFGVDPDNMLIIMHQNMAEQFVVLPPQEKLKMVEAAVGLEPYRRHVLEAKRKLSRIMSQEESINKLLESAEQTLNYWREQYDRYQQKKQLLMKRRFLERELAWAKVARKEETINELEAEIRRLKYTIEEIDGKVASSEGRVKSLQETLQLKRSALREAFEERVRIEGEKARQEARASLAKEILDDLNRLITERGDASKILREPITSFLTPRIENLKAVIDLSASRAAELTSRVDGIKRRLESLNREVDGLSEEILEERVNLALLRYRRGDAARSLNDLERSLNRSLKELEAEVSRAAEIGPRIAAVRSVEEILDEMRVTDGRIAALADVSEDVERMYESYSKLYLELKEKSRMVAENREKALKEVKARMDAWRTVIRRLIEQVDAEYRRILSYADAVGSVRFLNEHDIEAAGIEILVGFKGADPVPLNAYTQSGGERSTATMAFLLALQQHVKSPFRAIDEYDIHMDPRNREIMANLLISSLEGQGVQYLAITPNQIYFEGRDVHIITVQNVGGSSIIKESL
ncbi:MAG: chromosome assembly protein [Candidatus Bathyarchaeota archaeon B26-1]|nr:MAG: chromosome assembly protein [Candidatus Bathyarchaeota archaeon B26-1]